MYKNVYGDTWSVRIEGSILNCKLPSTIYSLCLTLRLLLNSGQSGNTLVAARWNLNLKHTASNKNSACVRCDSTIVSL